MLASLTMELGDGDERVHCDLLSSICKASLLRGGKFVNTSTKALVSRTRSGGAALSTAQSLQCGQSTYHHR